MSQHPSLLGSQKGKRHRSVIKRYEKLKQLMEKNKWDEENSIFRLPKIKSIRFKVKKEKAAAATAEAGTAVAQPGAVTAGGAQPQPAGAKPPAGAKQPAAEKQASGLAARQAPAKEKKAKA